MAGSLLCVLSYGLMCNQGGPMEVPPPVPLVGAQNPDPAAAPKGAASAVLARVQAFYDGTKDLEANFTQTYVHPVYGTKSLSKGKLQVKKPGMMVWDYDSKKSADVFVDGKTMWVVERDTKQVIKRNVEGSDIAGAQQFLFGGRQLTEDFFTKIASDTLTKRYGSKGHTAIQLKPKKKNVHYRQLILIVDDASGRVDSFVVLNGDKSTNHFVLSGIGTNAGIPASAFTFKKPAGYTVVRE